MEMEEDLADRGGLGGVGGRRGGGGGGGCVPVPGMRASMGTCVANARPFNATLQATQWPFAGWDTDT